MIDTRMTPRGWSFALAGLLAFAVVAPPGAAQKPSKRKPVSHTVTMEGMVFKPARLAIAAGDRVSWVNKDVVAHTATGNGFDSKTIPPDRSWSHTFAKAGAFDYVCDFHPTMKGALKVK